MESTAAPIQLEVDLPGRIANMRLAPGNATFSLFEAIVNSIHAVLEDSDSKHGSIVITILRGTGNKTVDGDFQPGSIIGFRVKDDGIGFTDSNFGSFRRSDSTTKARLGGKGVGRLLWLKVFRSVKIESVFTEHNSNKVRVFSFSTEGITRHNLNDTQDQRSTTVELKSPHDYYKGSLQQTADALAIRIVEHCLEYFISEQCPKVYLTDPDANYHEELGALFHNDLQSEIKRDTFRISNADFQITHLMLRGRRNSRHALHFCAHSRRVKDEPLQGRIAGLSGGLRPPGSDEDLAYQGYVSGPLLNELVNTERANFNFDGLFERHSETPPDGHVSYESLLDSAIKYAQQFLEPTLRPILDAHRSRVRDEIESTYPQYKHLLKHRASDIATIQPGTSGRDLDLALYRIEQQFDSDSRAALHKELDSPQDPDESPDSRRQRLEDLIAQLNDSGVSKLARHVAYRRAIIEFLENQVSLQTTGKHSLEEAIHMAVCPTRTSSDDTPASQMNLWLLDDRLYFHYFLSSDLPFKDMADGAKRDSPDRPDLAIFQRTMAFSDSTDSITAVVLVEFKRPSRDDYNADRDGSNPVSQIIKYVSTLKDGKGKTAKGRSIHIRENTPFYAYIVADFTPTLRNLLITREDFTPTPDGEGFFKFVRNLNLYIEAISFQKMIKDAKKRNQAFFDKLNIPLD